MRLLAVLAAALVAGLLAAALPVAAVPSGQGITVAVLDSGVDGSHPDLAGRVEHVRFGTPGPLPLPLDLGDLVSDPDGQGTAVASLVAGTTLGVAPRSLGVASQMRILDLQVSAAYTGTALDPATETAAIAAMDYLLQDPGRAQVALLSFASRGVSPAGAATLAEQARGLREAGVVVLVPSAPAMSALQGEGAVVTVGPEDCSGGRQASADQPRKPDLVAPHRNLEAATPATLTEPNGGTTPVTGTAFAAALAAGTAALMLDGRDGLTADAAAALLRASASDAGDPGIDDSCGFGLLGPAQAVAAAESWEDPFAAGAGRDTPGAGALATVAALAAVAGGLRRGQRRD